MTKDFDHFVDSQGQHAYKTGSCAACLDMGTIVIAMNSSDGVVCEDPCSETDWSIGPGFPSQSIIQASHQAAQTGLVIHRSQVSTGARFITAPSQKPYEWEFGAFMQALARSGFGQAGREIGLASVALDNFRIPGLEIGG
ncbi:hypothetical protein TCAL_16675 [Tigriopus californicus]|uniref:Uncharacterized protein n=1 Tax=Tigriopus californicus TaxID=6832 RepID=A0A553PJF1_TIGCA|nr:hypothetical protein TCAL_16675 [Tigriopus californicus]